jgi:hypothetical protein
MTRDEELMIEKAIAAHRRRGADGSIQPSPAWADLNAEQRQLAFDEAQKLRRLEGALDRRGLSSTAHAVLERIRLGGNDD